MLVQRLDKGLRMELPYTKYNLFERRRVENLGQKSSRLVLALDCVGAGSDSPLIFHKLESTRHKRPSPYCSSFYLKPSTLLVWGLSRKGSACRTKLPVDTSVRRARSGSNERPVFISIFIFPPLIDMITDYTDKVFLGSYETLKVLLP